MSIEVSGPDRSARAVRPGGGRRVVSPALVGRLDELASMVSTVRASPSVTVVEGEAGIGKTRLVAELRAQPEVADLRFVTGSCRRVREPFPMFPVLEAVRDAAADLTDVGLSPVAGALRPLLPELDEVLPPGLEPLDDRIAERHRVFRGLIELLGALGPVVLVIDDLHWADEQTVEFLDYVLAEPPPGLSLVLSFRSEEVDPGVRALTAKPPASVGSTHVILAPFDEAGTGALAAAILDMDRVSDDFAAYLCERTSGLPFAVEELLALLQERGRLTRRDGRWARKALDELAVPTRIRDSVLERVSRLTDDGRSVVEAATVLQTSVPVALLLDTCRVPRDRALAGLEEAFDVGLLVEHDKTVGYRHLLAAQAVYDAVPLPRRQDLHGRAADALAAVRPVPLGQRAHHLRHADRLDEWVSAAEQVAAQAVALGSDEEAARLLDDVLQHVPLDIEQRVRLAVKLGRAAEGTRHSQAARDTLVGVLNERPDPSTQRGELQFWLATMLDTTDRDPQLQLQMYRAAAAELDATQVGLRVRAMLGLANPTRSPGVSLVEHRTWLSHAIATIPGAGDRALEVFLLSKAAMVAVAMGDPTWRELTDPIVTYARGSGDPRSMVNACASAGYAATYAGHHTLADELLAAGAVGVGELGRRVELKYRSIYAVLNFLRGRWDALDEEIATLDDGLAGYPSNHVDVELVAGCLVLARGDLDDARRRFAGIFDDAEIYAGLDILPVAVAAQVRLDLAAGQVSNALSAAEQLLGSLETKGMWAPIARALPAITQAKVEGARLPDARALVERAADELDGLDVPIGPPSLRHSRGLVAMGAKDWSTAASQLVAAAGLYEPLQCPYETAQAREQAAVSLCQAGDSRAVEMLRSAIATYEILGARWDLDRAASVARANGLALPARHRGGQRGYGAELSPRECEVAELAATGRTNREIADQLFVSASTVKKQLAAAMRKLGVTTRVALARRLTLGDQGDGTNNGPPGP